MLLASATVCVLLAAAAPTARAPRPAPARAAPRPAPAAAPAATTPRSDPAIAPAEPSPPGAAPRSGPGLDPAPATTAASPTPALAPSAPASRARPRPALRLALPDVKATGEVPPRQVALLEAALLAELRKLDGVLVIGMGEIRQMLSFEYQRQLLGCAADGACLAEIGGALGTDEMVHAAVIVEDRTATFSVHRISMRAARVTGSHTKRLVRAGGEELLGDVGPAIQEVFEDRPLRAGATRGVDRAMALRLNPPPLPRWPFFATAGAAVAAAAGGAAMAYLSSDARSQWKSLAQRSVTEPVPGGQLGQLQATAERRARTANVLFVAAGGLALAAGVEALFTDWHGYRAAVAVGPAGPAVKVGGSF